MRRIWVGAVALSLVLLPPFPQLAQGLDNGLALTPPQGWRSWNAYTCQDSSNTTFSGGDIISDAAMRTAMHAVLDKSRSVQGVSTTLASLGYNYISMDDGWQQCNCSTTQDIDPTLQPCSIGDCRGGRCSWHEKPSGTPMVNKHRFPSGMKSLVDYGHSLGLKVGSYLNNCICMDKDPDPKYEQDVAWFTAAGFDEVKIDNCGSSHNVSYYSELFNRSGKAIRIEDCHTSPTHPDIASDGSVICPMNMYRAGGDIKASFGSIIGEIYSTIEWNDRKKPLSFPGCWSYPDMMQVGNFRGPEPLRSAEERTHFSLWVINSAPLVLGFDMGNSTTMDRVWPWITNPDMLAISHAWHGHPGTLVKTYPSVGLPVKMAVQASCTTNTDGGEATIGWSIKNGSLVAPGDGGLCMVGIQNSGVVNENKFSCPPATTSDSTPTQCGNVLYNCSAVDGVWFHNTTTGQLAWAPHAGTDPKDQKCLGLSPGHVADDRVGASRGPLDPASASMSMQSCATAGKPPSNTTVFTLGSSGELRNIGVDRCLGVGQAPGAQVWAKPISAHELAFVVLNPLTVTQHVTVSLADLPGNPCTSALGVAAAPSPCTLRDVWSAKNSTVGASGSVLVELRPHESIVYIVSRAAVA